MNQQIVVIANGAPYGSESLFNALRLSIALNEQGGASLKLFLMSDAVSAALAGQAPAEGYNLRQMLEILLAQGGNHPSLQDLHRCSWYHGPATDRGYRGRYHANAGTVDPGRRQGTDLLITTSGSLASLALI